MPIERRVNPYTKAGPVTVITDGSVHQQPAYTEREFYRVLYQDKPKKPSKRK